MAKIVFLGKLRDFAGASGFTQSNAPSLFEFLELVGTIDAEFYEALTSPGVRIALNHTIIPLGAQTPLTETDELAFMPPFSGG